MNNTWQCAGHQRQSLCCLKRKMLHDVALHGVIGGHQTYIHREIYGASNFVAG